MSSVNEGVVARLLDAISTGDEASVKGLIGPKGKSYENGRLVSTGPDEYWDNIVGYRTAFPDFQATIDEIFSNGDRVAIGVTCRGTHLGDLDGAAPTGRKIEFQANVLLRVAGGKVAEDRTVLDQLSMMQQLGLLEGEQVS